MMREWPYTASNRDELGCTSPLTSRFPLALEKSLGPLSSVRIQCFRIEGLLVFFFYKSRISWRVPVPPKHALELRDMFSFFLYSSLWSGT